MSRLCQRRPSTNWNKQNYKHRGAVSPRPFPTVKKINDFESHSELIQRDLEVKKKKKGAWEYKQRQKESNRTVWGSRGNTWASGEKKQAKKKTNTQQYVSLKRFHYYHARGSAESSGPICRRAPAHYVGRLILTLCMLITHGSSKVRVSHLPINT